MVNSPHVMRIEVTTKWLLIVQDPDDDKFVDCAVAGQADYIVTNDGHFNILKTIPAFWLRCTTKSCHIAKTTTPARISTIKSCSCMLVHKS